MLVVILNQHLIKKRKQEEYKTAHSSPPDYETRNIVSSSDGVSCAEKGEKMRDIQNDLFDVKEACCESCKYNIPGKTWCSKYKRIKPVNVMIGRTKCEKYCMLNNVIMASIVGFAVRYYNTPRSGVRA